MPGLEEIGQRLVKLRGNRTQEEVASSVGISYQALSNYEKGLRSPRDELKKKLADFYEKTVQEIFFD